MQEHTSIVGIDISKSTLDYTWLPGGKASQVPNSPEGVCRLVKTLKKLSPELVVMEATGGYQNLLSEKLHESAIPLKVVNPRQVRDFARSLNRLGKTDRLDARILAEFGMSRKLSPDAPRRPELLQLSYLLQRREQLNSMMIAEKGHLEHAPSSLRTSIQEHIALMESHAKIIESEIRALINANPEFSETDSILQSIPGLGPITSATIIAELPEVTLISRKAVAALAGVAPFNRDSGAFRGKRHISGGRGKVRKVMYCAMRACLRWNPVIKSWFDKFLAAGKPYKVAVIACVRKLLVILRAMLINRTYWNPQLLPLIS